MSKKGNVVMVLQFSSEECLHCHKNANTEYWFNKNCVITGE